MSLLVREPDLQAAATREPSRYLAYLPSIYSDNDFIGRFLHIFQDIFDPIENTVKEIARYFDPRMTPEGLLPWLATWVDLVLDESWPVEKRRTLIGSAVELYRWRGTLRGLREYLRIYSGVEPEVEEFSSPMRLGPHTVLGWNTIIGDGIDHTFKVRLLVPDPSVLDEEKAREIIQAEKPAHTAFILEVRAS